MEITVKNLLTFWGVTSLLIPVTTIATILLLPISVQNNMLGMMAVIVILILMFATILCFIFSVMMLIDKSKQEMVEQGVTSHNNNTH